jgi:RNA polymerase sigma-70 factor (ECF subfamily)
MRDDPVVEGRFRRVFDAYHDQIYAYCRRRSDAETAREATSDVFLTAWRRFADLPDGDKTLPWLYGVARRVLANEFRRQKRHRRLVARLKVRGRPVFADVETVIVRKEEYQAVLDAVARLRPQDQELLRLALWEELSHGDIGQIFGCSAHAVDQRIARAAKRLASELRRTGHKQQQNVASDPLREEMRHGPA